MRMASAVLHASSVSSGSGLPVESMAAPPKSKGLRLMEKESLLDEMSSSTRVACSTTSGPMPSPGRTTTL
jgi:hypothetical protein